jgi:hypothetical protein
MSRPGSPCVATRVWAERMARFTFLKLTTGAHNSYPFKLSQFFISYQFFYYNSIYYGSLNFI